MTPEHYLERLRALCRTLPDTAEKLSWGHPNFTAGGRMFAAIEVWRGRPTMGIATSKEEQASLAKDPRFAEAPYVGKLGWVTVWLDSKPEWSLLEDLLRKAHARILGQGTPKTAGHRKEPPA